MPDNSHNAEERSEQRSQKLNRRKPRRTTAPGTGPTTANGPEPRLDEVNSESMSDKNLTQRDRWLLEQKPPHY